jgi:hypothetical protein
LLIPDVTPRIPQVTSNLPEASLVISLGSADVGRTSNLTPANEWPVASRTIPARFG